MEKNSTQNGFTLIELIVVVGIIALLSSLVLASLSDSKQRAENAGTISQIKEYNTAIGLYILNNRNNYPNVADTNMHCIGSGSKKCLWAGVEISTENSGSLAALGNHISGLPFVDTPTLLGIGTYKGLLYQCNDINCNTANFYWPEVGKSSCTLGDIHYSSAGGVICTQFADGSGKN